MCMNRSYFFESREKPEFRRFSPDAQIPIIKVAEKGILNNVM